MTTYPTLASGPGGAGAPPRAEGAVTSARVDWAPVPKVNLLPPEILQARRLARLKRGLAAAVVVTVVGCAGATVWAQSGASDAQAQLDVVQARGTLLRADQARYAAVPKLLDLIQSAGAAREKALAHDVLWYGFLTDLAVTTPDGVTLTGLQVTLDKPASGQDPLVKPGIGSVTFTGTAQHFPEVAAWLDAVATMHGLDGSTLASAVRSPESGASGVTFTSTVQVTSKALTHRYDRKAD
jgi:Tfp pilus assembly protein PilN